MSIVIKKALVPVRYAMRENNRLGRIDFDVGCCTFLLSYSYKIILFLDFAKQFDGLIGRSCFLY